MMDIDEGWDDQYTDGLVGCDGYYSDLDNNWDQPWGEDQNTWDATPEVYIGRLSADSGQEMQMLIDNILNYEKNPVVGDWMNQALFAGSIIVFDEDWDNDNVKDYDRSDLNHFNNFLAQQLLPTEMDATFLGETQGLQTTDYYYDLSLNKENLLNQLEAGASFGIIGGHANPRIQVHTMFITDHDGDGLMDRNGSYYDLPLNPLIDQWQHEIIIENTDEISPANDAQGLYVLFGCSAGTFEYYDDGTEYNCLSEMMLKSNAIGCLAGWNVVWEDYGWYERDHGGWFMEGMTFRFFEQLMMDPHPGKALAEAKADLVIDRQNPLLYDESVFIASEEKLLKQLNLLGDPEVSIWLGKPSPISYSIQKQENYILNVTSDGEPLNEAMITITISTDLIAQGKSDLTGQFSIPTSWFLLENITLTITHHGNLPIIIELETLGDLITDEKFVLPGYPSYFLIGISFITLTLIKKKRSLKFSMNEA
ncbi:MAG: C25 family cysteine peptidase [Promethearchaeota archaeon]